MSPRATARDKFADTLVDRRAQSQNVETVRACQREASLHLAAEPQPLDDHVIAIASMFSGTPKQLLGTPVANPDGVAAAASRLVPNLNTAF